MSPYVYGGTQRGEQDPWAPKPKPAPKPPPIPRHTIPLQPCGTKAAHKRHQAHGETPCEPCKEARRAYDRKRAARRYASQEARAKKRANDRARWQ